MTMIEKVARVICKTSTGDEENWEGYLDRAKAAIAAMREPTEEMVEAFSYRPVESDPVRKMWQAMIDAALKKS